MLSIGFNNASLKMVVVIFPVRKRLIDIGPRQKRSGYVNIYFFFFYSCSYDYVELIPEDDDEGPKYCGDKSDVLKLTRYVTKRPKLRIHFVSDYSHSFSGFKARVSAEHGK
jgi:hypothetical protein